MNDEEQIEEAYAKGFDYAEECHKKDMDEAIARIKELEAKLTCKTAECEKVIRRCADVEAKLNKLEGL